jgi:hypothetical protein
MNGRAAMVAELEMTSTSPTKTFVIEAHTDHPSEYLADLAGKSQVAPTEDAFVHKINTEYGTFWVDHLDSRFWSLHTKMRTDKAAHIVNGWIRSRHDLDWMWLPSDHIRHAWPGARTRQARTDFRSHALVGHDGADNEDLRFHLSGRNPEKFLNFLANSPYKDAISFHQIETDVSDPDFGFVKEALNRSGKFIASGDSFMLHGQFVSTVVARYAHLIRLCEARAIAYSGWGSDEGGGTLSGGPIVINFSKPILDQDAFLAALFSSRAPFRLWGLPEPAEDGVVEVEAVDLHVGQKLMIDVGDTWMRVYLEPGGCGNTVARLVSNLQHRFDAALTLRDLDLNAAISGSQSPETATANVSGKAHG